MQSALLKCNPQNVELMVFPVLWIWKSVSKRSIVTMHRDGAAEVQGSTHATIQYWDIRYWRVSTIRERLVAGESDLPPAKAQAGYG
jgi:hypothetical protein